MLINGPSHFQYKLPRQPAGLQEKLGLGTLIAFLTSKVLRSGPRLAVHLVTGFVVLVLVLKVLPEGYVRYNVLSWHRGSPSRGSVSGVASDGSVAGGLRMVVFGTHDVANPGRMPGPEYAAMDKRSWTELLSAELNCSSYLSFVPSDTPSRAMTSTRIYAETMDTVTNATFGTQGPGMDYAWLPEKYPVLWDTADLEQQISAFLSLPRPQNPAAETLWVISFGAWDIWSLASEPREFGMQAVDAILNHIMKQVERLYQAALDESSVAWSNSSLLLDATPVEKPSATAFNPEDGQANAPIVKPVVPTPALEKTDYEKKPQLATDRFRILIPKVFDPSLTPGWQTERPDLAAVHSKAEQMRNAAALTDRWNMQLNRRLFKWVWTDEEANAKLQENSATPVRPFPKKVLTGNEAMSAFMKMLEDNKPKKNPKGKLAADKKKDEERKKKEEERKKVEEAKKKVEAMKKAEEKKEKEVKKNAAERLKEEAKKKKVLQLPQPVQPRGLELATEPQSEPEPEPEPEPETGVTVVINNEPVPTPQRDAIFFEMNEFIADLIVETQFRDTRLTDSLGVGTKPPEDGFLDVRNPCTEDFPGAWIPPTPPASPPVTPPVIRGRAPIPSDSDSNSPTNETSICDAPQDHLFFTPFTLSSRAVGMIARLAADVVRKEETIRAHMAKYNLVPIQQELPQVSIAHGGGWVVTADGGLV